MNACYRNSNGNANNTKEVADYMRRIDSEKLPHSSVVFLTDEEKMRRYIIGNIESLDKDELHERFGITFEGTFPEIYKELKSLRLIEEIESIMRLTDKSIIFRDTIAYQFFSEPAKALEEAYRKSR